MWRRSRRTETTAPAAQDTPPGPVEVIEDGSFARACCHECGWRGPGRRARSNARSDADVHPLVCSATVDEVCTPDRERLTAHGRS